MIGPTDQGVRALINADPDEHWNTFTNSVECTGPDCSGERTVSIPLFDPYEYELARRSGRHEIVITKVLGFFVDRMDGNDVIGYFVGAPGVVDPAQPSGGPTSWLRVIRLVR